LIVKVTDRKPSLQSVIWGTGAPTPRKRPWVPKSSARCGMPKVSACRTSASNN